MIKNAALRSVGNPLPIRAKARLCAQASGEPMALNGLLKLDSPTVQRVGVIIFLQLMLDFGWTGFWRKADIKSAFLQGTWRNVDEVGELYLRPPKGRPLKGVREGDYLRVLRSVYGLPDAPRKW